MYPFLHSEIQSFRRHPLLGTAVLVLALGIAIYWAFPYADRAKDFLLYRNDPNYSKCRDEKIADACVGFCKDGFESILFYDRNKYDLDSLKPGMYFEDSVLKRGFALRYVSVCRPCEIRYAVGKLEVGCHEFYRVIDSASKRTRIKTIEAGI
jgi:hypothetical protein